MKKLLILTALLACPLQQAHPFSNGTNTILYSLGSVVAGVGGYLSYKQAKKITATLNNPEELAELSEEEAEKMRKNLAIYYALTGGCAATAAITAALACKSCYGWSTEPTLNKLVTGKRVIIFKCVNATNINEQLLNKDGSVTVYNSKGKEVKTYTKDDIKELKVKAINDKKNNSKEYVENMEEFKVLNNTILPSAKLIFKVMTKQLENPESLTTEEVILLDNLN